MVGIVSDHRFPSDGDRRRVVAGLRERVRGMETGAAADVAPLGAAAIDDHLPWGGLPRGCLHGIGSGDGRKRGQGGGVGEEGALTALAAVLAGRLAPPGRAVLWLPRSKGLYPPGLASLGLPPERLVVIRASAAARPWAMEEALRVGSANGGGIGVVLAEMDRLDLVAARRLQLAAERGGVAGLVLGSAVAPGAASAGAVTTRWRVTAAPSVPEAGEPGVGDPRWRLTLERCRGGAPGEWLVEWRGAGVGLAAVESGRETRAPDAFSPLLSVAG